MRSKKRRLCSINIRAVSDQSGIARHHYRHETSLFSAWLLTMVGTGRHQSRHPRSLKLAPSITISGIARHRWTGTESHHYYGI